jgi:hypothetical protein
MVGHPEAGWKTEALSESRRGYGLQSAACSDIDRKGRSRLPSWAEAKDYPLSDRDNSMTVLASRRVASAAREGMARGAHFGCENTEHFKR